MFSVILAQSCKRFVRGTFHWNFQTVCALRKACYSDGISSQEGPLRLYNSYLQKQVLKPDDCQLQVVYKLQGVYERLKNYDPRLQPGKFDLFVHLFSYYVGKIPGQSHK